MKRIVIMALSFGLVTTVVSAQNTANPEMKQEQKDKQEKKSKSKVEAKDETGKTKTKTETEVKHKDAAKTDHKDQGVRSNVQFNSAAEVKNWCKGVDNSWRGIDNSYYRIGANGALEKSTDNMNWRLSKSGRWQDDQGTFFRLKDNKLESSKDGSTWAPSKDNSWRGHSGVWYRYNDGENTIYSSQQFNSEVSGSSANGSATQDTSRVNDFERDDRRDVAPGRDNLNLDTTAPERDRRDIHEERTINNMQDRNLKRNMEIQDEKGGEIRSGEQSPLNKNRYNDKTSPK